MICILGKTCSGKTTIVDELLKNHGFSKIITYTTRPMRTGETNHKDYHFISNKEFMDKIREDFFAEWKTYTTKQGIWHYGVSLQDIINSSDKSIVIITPEGFRDLRERFNFNCFSIYINCSNNIIIDRLIKRGDNNDEAARRLKADNKDFKHVEKDVDRIVYNNGDINETIKEIVRLINERRNI